METIFCPYCGKEMDEINNMWYCENCGAREIEQGNP
jgi:predicted amidophosphoribosyltransferase